MRLRQPFIGLRGVPSMNDALDLGKIIAETTFSAIPAYLVRVTTTMSRRKLYGYWSRDDPPQPELWEHQRIFAPHDRVQNTIRYVDHEKDVRQHDLFPNAELHDLLSVLGCVEQHLHALELDMAFLSPHTIRELRKMRPFLEIGICVGEEFLYRCARTPDGVIQSLEPYGDMIDYVVFDQRLGGRLGIDTRALRPFLEAVTRQLPHLHLAVEGGLAPENLESVRELLRDFRDLSWGGYFHPYCSAIGFDFLRKSLALASEVRASKQPLSDPIPNEALVSVTSARV